MIHSREYAPGDTRAAVRTRPFESDGHGREIEEAVAGEGASLCLSRPCPADEKDGEGERRDENIPDE